MKCHLVELHIHTVHDSDIRGENMHSALAFCTCQIAQDYRAVKKLVKFGHTVVI